VLADAGFDVTQELDLGATGIAGLTGRGLLVGNTRALWPIFVAARAADPALLASHDPLDLYTERTIAAAFPGARAWFAHRQYDGAYLPFQRIAVTAGLGALAPTQLVIHPIYGPWFALRAVVALDGDPPPLAPPLMYRCTCECEARLADALQARDWRAWLAVRDACCVGREFRYGDSQLAYHYTKALELLS
jgi:cyanocobalamin reductase (cyanide-eliminating) / alkylcobalamin dealkylase